VKVKKLTILAGGLLVAACAEPSLDNGGTAPRDEPEYTTGSNIPRKHHETPGAQIYDRESVERAQQSSPGAGQPR
jgi:hypothetical protein